jgi:hypothetical protein
MFDTDGIVFVIDNSATCIICNDRTQFVGDLRLEQCEVETSLGTGRSEFIGTIRLRLTDNAGVTHPYDVPDAIYDPKSPFNILGVPFLGEYFGSKDSTPTFDEDGNWIKSSATKSTFVWDHGKHERNFSHGLRKLPELTCESGVSYFTAFCSRVSRFYHDKVHFAFSSAHSIIPSDEPTKKSASPVSEYEFELGCNLLFKDGSGTNEMVVYEGASPDGLQHTVRIKADGTKVVTRTRRPTCPTSWF